MRDIYDARTSEKAKMNNQHWLTSTRLSVTWRGEVTWGMGIQSSVALNTTH